jgi:hypothetical protein
MNGLDKWRIAKYTFRVTTGMPTLFDGNCIKDKKRKKQKDIYNIYNSIWTEQRILDSWVHFSNEFHVSSYNFLEHVGSTDPE